MTTASRDRFGPWFPHVARQVDRLIRAGVLRDHHWREALLAAPRHVFVPAHYTPTGPGGTWQRHTPGEATNSTTWLDQIHSDTALTVALSARDLRGRRHPVAVSPTPELTVRCLQALGIEAGTRMLEIGTGSGHTTALLTHRLGNAHVTSIEIDPELQRAAATRLDSLGMNPTLLVGDATGNACLTDRHERYDRVLIGYETDTVPAAWIRRARPGGRVLARIGGALGAGRHVLLVRPGQGRPGVRELDAELVGRFQDWPGPLPARRRAVGRPARRRPPAPATGLVRARSTPISPASLTDDTPLGMLAQLHLPPGTTQSVRSTGTSSATYLQAPDGSWAEIVHTLGHRGRHDTREAGPTRLLPAVEDAVDTYRDLGSPAWTTFGVTATTTGSRIWHDRPATGPSWPLLPAPSPTGVAR